METLLLAFWGLSTDMGIYILFGLLGAGILHQLVKEEWIQKHLGQSNSRSVIKAAMYGTPLPLCSCSVIPFAASLRQHGASKGSTLSFLISTPITGIDSILATFGMFGWAFTLYRLLSSVVMAIAAGILINLFEPAVPKPKFTFTAPNAAASVVVQTKTPVESKPPFSVKEVFRYGFVTLLGSFTKPLFWGLVIGAFISTAIPANLNETIGEHRIWGYLIAVAIATPMYVCATASLPIAASLIIAGISPGAAFIFLSAGPATNTVTIGVVKSMLGLRALVVYLSVIVIGSVAFGALIDLVFDSLQLTLDIDFLEEDGIIHQLAGAILLALITWHMVSGWFRKKDSCCSGGSCCS